MLATRVIPCLLLRAGRLVKTERFRGERYVGDPINTVRLLNDKYVDELIFLDIGATVGRQGPPMALLKAIASECFMPFCYGGGVTSLTQIEALIKLGTEKVAMCTSAYRTPDLIATAAREFGSQAVVAAIDVKRTWLGKWRVAIAGARELTPIDPVTMAKRMQEAGAGEILVTAVDRDGTMQGYDLQLIRAVSSAVTVPVVACGGAGSLPDLAQAVQVGGAAAAAAGSLFVYRGRNRAVLVNYPTREELSALFGT
jgi:cyclase